MKPTPTQFGDGEAYERMMGRWSRVVGEQFLDWLAPAHASRWLDVGCGNGAFTELVVSKCAPIKIHGVDPSEGQLDYARARAPSDVVAYSKGDAQSLPFGEDEFDIVALSLAINMVPEPADAVVEMARVTGPGGWVSAYMWDIPGGGFTMEPIRQALFEMGVPSPIFGAEATTAEAMQTLWDQAGLTDVSVTRIDIRLSFDDFAAFWSANTAMANTVVRALEALSAPDIEKLKDSLRSTLPADPDGRITYGAFANAVKGRVP